MTLDPATDPDLGALRTLSARLGRDPDRVQAAGGNTSLKRDGTMWIKASGTWLARAEEEEILVPVRLDASWMCPVHAVVIESQAGTCRLCGRELVPVTVTEDRAVAPNGGLLLNVIVGPVQLLSATGNTLTPTLLL